MFRALAFVVLLVMSIGVKGFSGTNEVHIQKFWTDTHMSFEYLENHALNKRTCTISGQNFYGCVMALNSLFRDNGRGLTTVLVTAEWQKKLQGYDDQNNIEVHMAIEKDFGFYKIISIKRLGYKSDNKDFDFANNSELVNFKALTKQEVVFWRRNFTQQKLHPLPLKDILLWARQNKITNENLSYKAGRALNIFTAMARDAHGYLMPKALYTERQKNSKSDYVGIGIDIRLLADKVIVTDPVEGSPGYRAGLQVNDEIIGVEAQPVDGLSTSDIADLIHGPENTKVTLQIRRGSQVIPIVITREKIHDDVVTSKLLTSSEKLSGRQYKVGYIKIRDFVADTVCKDLEKDILDLQGRGIESLIVDLRGNPGGNTDLVTCALGLFIGSGKKAFDVYQDYFPQPGMSQSTVKNKILTVPVITLVNSTSASASEIFAGVLQDYQESLIVGVRTYGKGSVQHVMDLNDGAGSFWPQVKDMYRAETRGRYYLPGRGKYGRHSPQVVGIIPELEVYAKPNPTVADKFALREEDSSPIVLSQQKDVAPPSDPTLVSYYKNCTAKNGVARSEFGTMTADYQRLVATDAAVCAIHFKQDLMIQ